MEENDKVAYGIERRYLRTNNKEILIVRLTDGYVAVEKAYPPDPVLKEKTWGNKSVKWLTNFRIKQGNEEIDELPPEVTYDIEIDLDDLDLVLDNNSVTLVWYIDGQVKEIPNQQTAGKKIKATGLNRGDPPIGVAF